MNNPIPDKTFHDDLISEGIASLEDALAKFMHLDSDHAQALKTATSGLLSLAQLLFAIYKK